MPNRVIKDSIWSSPTLATLPLDAQLHWPRWLLMADDWGCFNADPDVIKGLVYPKTAVVTVKKITELLKTYMDAGLLFAWQAKDRVWGFFTSWHGHQFCNATHQNEDGTQLRHKRKTPEPPKTDLMTYLEQHNQIIQTVTEELERVRAVQNKYRNPNPNPNPNPKKTYGEFQNVKLTDHELKKLEQKFGKDDSRRWIERLSQYVASKGKKYQDFYATILQWAAKDEKNGKPIAHPDPPGEFDHLQKLNNDDYWICGCPKADTGNRCRHWSHGMTREESYRALESGQAQR